MNVLTEWLRGQDFEEVTPRAFYRDIFPAGELDTAGAFTKGMYTGVVVAVSKDRKADGRAKVRRYSLTDELDAVELAVASDDFCICSPISYAGKARTAANARNLYAITVDVDNIRMERGGPLGLRNLWHHVEVLRRIPKPTYIVSSGSGIHLYYVLRDPIPLFEDTAKELQEFKRKLTFMIWHDAIVDIKSVKDIQYEGIYQGFRMPGTVTKAGARAVAFKTGYKVDMEYLNGFIWEKGSKVTRYAVKSKLTKAQAAERYPDWYKRRVIGGEAKGHWCVSRRLYDWWKGQILSGATVGHRYYCVMMLAVYAQKCSYFDAKHNPNPVTYEELERDAYSLLEPLDGLTVSEDNHFGNDDIQDALEAFEDRWTTYPRASVEYKSGIAIPANRRNGRTQAEHIKLMNFVRDEINHNTTWREGGGRPSQAETVETWRLSHPAGRKADCIRETGLSKSTVYRHWE